MDIVKTFTCKDCGKDLPKNNFYLRTARRNVLYQPCKQCVGKREAARRAANPPKPKPPGCPPREEPKVCLCCKELRDWHSFYRASTRPDGLSTWCRSCVRQKQREYCASRRDEEKTRVQLWREKNADKIHASQRKANRKAILKFHYGLTLEDYQAMSDEQGGVCAVCRREEKLHVDHNHKTWEIRGLLCGTCNRALGMLRDDATLIKRLAFYSQKKSTRVIPLERRK